MKGFNGQRSRCVGVGGREGKGLAYRVRTGAPLGVLVVVEGAPHARHHPRRRPNSIARPMRGTIPAVAPIAYYSI
eukprot:1180951-Prorocentrum_minimum.AAC.3